MFYLAGLPVLTNANADDSQQDGNCFQPTNVNIFVMEIHSFSWTHTHSLSKSSLFPQHNFFN